MTKSDARQERREAWVTPLEASLLLSIREGVYISPDDIKQLRKAGRIDGKAYKQVSERLTLYSRHALTDEENPIPAPVKKPDSKSEITPEIVAKWLENFPKTITSLEKSGKVIPHKEEAQQLVIQKKAIRISHQSGRYPKTAIKTS